MVTEAMRLVKNARTAHIFLYENGKLEFGAALNDDGLRNTPLAMPRLHGLTYTVARNGEQIIIEDMQKHALYANTPGEWLGSIIGMPLKFNDTIVGVMNLSRIDARRLQLLRIEAAGAAGRPGRRRHLQCQPASNGQPAGLQRYRHRASEPPRAG